MGQLCVFFFNGKIFEFIRFQLLILKIKKNLQFNLAGHVLHLLLKIPTKIYNFGFQRLLHAFVVVIPFVFVFFNFYHIRKQPHQTTIGIWVILLKESEPTLDPNSFEWKAFKPWKLKLVFLRLLLLFSMETWCAGSLRSRTNFFIYPTIRLSLKLRRLQSQSQKFVCLLQSHQHFLLQSWPLVQQRQSRTISRKISRRWKD